MIHRQCEEICIIFRGSLGPGEVVVYVWRSHDAAYGTTFDPDFKLGFRPLSLIRKLPVSSP